MRLWAGITEGLAAVRTGLADPHARLGDKARALAVLMESHRLMAGQSTSNVAVAEARYGGIVPFNLIAVDYVAAMTDEQREALTEIVDYLTREGWNRQGARDAIAAIMGGPDPLESLDPKVIQDLIATIERRLAAKEAGNA